jgi:hypothetical protein
MSLTCLHAHRLTPVISMGRGKAWRRLHYIVMHAVRHSALIMVFNLIQTSLYMERGVRADRAAGLIHVRRDVEVCADTCDHCCPHLHLGCSIQHSRACKESVLKLRFTDIVLCISC